MPQRRGRRRCQPPPAGAEQADHDRDADRVVGAGLALEQGARPAGDLAPPEHGEDHRRVGRRQGGADAAGRPPTRSRRPACASTAIAAVVTTVPATPSQATPPSAGRIRSQPMCMPPSNRISTSATVTIRWSVTIEAAQPGHDVGRDRRDDQEERRAPGSASHSASRLDPTASRTGARRGAPTWANGTRSSIGVLRVVGCDCRPDFPAHRRPTLPRRPLSGAVVTARTATLGRWTTWCGRC